MRTPLIVSQVYTITTTGSYFAQQRISYDLPIRKYLFGTVIFARNTKNSEKSKNKIKKKICLCKNFRFTNFLT